MKNTNWKLPFIIIAAVGAIILFAIFGIQGYQNKAYVLEESVDAALASIETQEKARVGKVYNLADCIKQYDKHEAETLIAIAEGRGSSGDIENVTTAITAVTEAYPELKSNTNYQTLMNELITIENMIAQYRENYTMQVKAYNNYVRKFPARMFLDFLGYERQNYEYLEFNASSDAPTNLFGE